MTKLEFNSWRQSIATQEVFGLIKQSVSQLEWKLAREAGIDDKSDRFNSGILKGLELVLNIEWEGEEEDA